MGEDMRLKFTAARYGPYADGVYHVLYRLNGTYWMGLEQQSIKPFEPVKLNYDRLEEVVSFISKELSFEQQQRLRDMLKLITGFESAVHASGAFLCPWQPHPTRIILQRLRVAEATQHHGLPPAVIDTYLDKEAVPVAGAVVEGLGLFPHYIG